MREIKFREWDTDELEMYNIDLKDETLIGSDEYPLMQYTGLKDKNGVEIYEGDIIVFKSWVGWELLENRFEVIFDNKSHSFCLEDKAIFPNIRALPISDIEVQSRQCTVIGNIHENPELLDKEI